MPVEIAVNNGEPAEGAHHAVEPPEVDVDDSERGDEGDDSERGEEGDDLESGDEDDDNAAARSRMDLTQHERNLAINIKEAIASTPGVDPVSDFMCAQLALIDGDNTEGAIQRVHHMQCFREEYGILDTAEDGKQCFMDYVTLFPEMHLCLSYNKEGGNYVIIYDNQKFRCKELCSDKSLRAFLGGTYYSCAALSPDFAAIRSGCIIVAECEGYDWKRDLDFKSLKKVWSEVATAYPIWFVKIKHFNAPNSMNIVFNMAKPFLPKNLRKKLEFGCQYEQRLDSIYLVPTVEAANLRLLTRFGDTLDLRFENERTFRL